MAYFLVRVSGDGLNWHFMRPGGEAETPAKKAPAIPPRSAATVHAHPARAESGTIACEMGYAFLQTLTPLQSRFLKCFEACASVTQAARWTKITRAAHYLWMKESRAYSDAFADSERVAARTLEDEAVRRAHQGLRKAVWYKGRIVGYETEFSDTLMALLLKGAMPKKYGTTNTAMELTGAGGGPIQLTQIREEMAAMVARLSPEARAEVAAQMLLTDGTEG